MALAELKSALFGEQDVPDDQVRSLLGKLDPRKKEIVELCAGIDGDPLTLTQISKKFGLTKERIRQLKARAIQQLRQMVK